MEKYSNWGVMQNQMSSQMWNRVDDQVHGQWNHLGWINAEFRTHPVVVGQVRNVVRAQVLSDAVSAPLE